jgi:hypothetical protein
MASLGEQIKRAEDVIKKFDDTLTTTEFIDNYQEALQIFDKANKESREIERTKGEDARTDPTYKRLLRLRMKLTKVLDKKENQYKSSRLRKRLKQKLEELNEEYKEATAWNKPREGLTDQDRQEISFLINKITENAREADSLVERLPPGEGKDAILGILDQKDAHIEKLRALIAPKIVQSIPKIVQSVVSKIVQPPMSAQLIADDADIQRRRDLTMGAFNDFLQDFRNTVDFKSKQQKIGNLSLQIVRLRKILSDAERLYDTNKSDLLGKTIATLKRDIIYTENVEREEGQKIYKEIEDQKVKLPPGPAKSGALIPGSFIHLRETSNPFSPSILQSDPDDPSSTPVSPFIPPSPPARVTRTSAGAAPLPLASPVVKTVTPKLVKTPSAPVSKPGGMPKPKVEGDPDFFFRLLRSQSALEEVRIVQSLFEEVKVWADPNNKSQLSELIKLQLELSRQMVAISCRFIAEKNADWPTLTHYIDTLPPQINLACEGIKKLLEDIAKGLPIGDESEAIRRTQNWLEVLEKENIRFSLVNSIYTSVYNAIKTMIENVEDLNKLTPEEKQFVAEYDATVLRNVAAQVVQFPRLRMPEIVAGSVPHVQPAIAAAKAINALLGDYSHEKAIDVPTVDKGSFTERFFKTNPNVKNLTSAFDKRSAALLKKAKLGQSAEISKALTDRRTVQLTQSQEITYKSDLAGKLPPFFPVQVVDSLLPFVLAANLIFTVNPNTVDGSPTFVPVDTQRLENIDLFMEMTILMSQPERLLADNLELTFGVGDHGYFAEPEGVRIVGRFARVLEDLPDWTRKIEKISETKVSEDQVKYIERAMLSIISVITDYCAIRTAQAGGICDIIPDFTSTAPGSNNLSRANAIMKMALAALAESSKSVLGRPLENFAKQVVRVMSNLGAQTIRLTKGDIKGSFVESPVKEGTAEERLIESIDAIRALFQGVDRNATGRTLSSDLVDTFLDRLAEVIRDLSVVAAAPANTIIADELSTIVSDLEKAMDRMRERQKDPTDSSKVGHGAWLEGKHILDPNFLKTLKTATSGSPTSVLTRKIAELYRDVAFVVAADLKSGWGKRDIPIFGSLVRSKQAKILPSQGTVDFAMKTPGLQNLSPLIDKTKLVEELAAQKKLIGGKESFDNLGKALKILYGTQVTKVAINYRRLVHFLKISDNVSNMIVVLAPLVVWELVDGLLGKGILTSIQDKWIRHMVYQLYDEMQNENLSVGTEDLGKAIAAIIPRIPTAIVVDEVRVAQSIFNLVKQAATFKTRPSETDILRILIAEVTVAAATQLGALTRTVPGSSIILQQAVASGIARVGPFPGGSIPAWTGVSLPTK